MPVRTKNLALEGLRGIASLNVVLGHFLFSFFPYLAHDVRPYPGAVARFGFEKVMRYFPFTFLYLADSAVSVFFVLSGYVLTGAFYRTGSIECFQNAATKRYFRLVIPAFISIMLAWILLECGAYMNQLAPKLNTAGWIMVFYKDPVNFTTALARGLIGAPLLGQAELNRPLWTVQIEIIGSILLFACYALFGNRSKIILSLWFWYFAFVLSRGSAGILNYAALLIGSFVHLVEPRLRQSPWVSRVCLIAGLIGVSFTHAKPYAFLDKMRLPDMTPFSPDFNTNNVLFWHTTGAVFLVAGVIGSVTASRVLNHKIPVYLGRVSFSIYLLHFPLIMSLCYAVANAGFDVGMNYIEYSFLALAALLAALFPLAEMFYRTVDAPSMRLADQITKWMAGRAVRSIVDDGPDSVVSRAAPQGAAPTTSML